MCVLTGVPFWYRNFAYKNKVFFFILFFLFLFFSFIRVEVRSAVFLHMGDSLNGCKNRKICLKFKVY